MVEAAHDLAAELEMRKLILADRHGISTHDRDVAKLHQRIAQKSVGGDLAAQLFDLVLEGRHALQPRDRNDHRKQHLQPADLRNVRLDVDRAARRVDAGC